MKEAVEKARNKDMTLREASERYSVPKNTLGGKVTDEQMLKIPVAFENDSAVSSLFEDSLNTTASQNILEKISPLLSSSSTKSISRHSIRLIRIKV